MVQQSPALLELTTKLAGIQTVNFLVYHHAARNGQLDRMSQCVQDFRNGAEPQTSRWLSLVKEVAEDLGTCDLVVRALGCSETSARHGSPLDQLCEVIARQIKSHYQPDRLTKERTTRKLQGLGGRVAHQKELGGAYSFDGLGLRNDARILVVDDMLATGATLEAITSAIHASLPGAIVFGFVLSRAGSATSASGIDPEFLVSTTAAIVPRQGAAKPSRGEQRSKGARGRTPKPSASKKPVPAQTHTASANRKTTYIMTVIGVLLALVIIGAVVPLRSTPKEHAAQISNEELAAMIKETETKQPLQVDSIAVKGVVPERKNLHPGVVTTPSIGLRTNHSLDARTLKGTVVRLGERVEILRRHIADSGPDWLQVRTKSGQVGWALASTITEPRRRD